MEELYLQEDIITILLTTYNGEKYLSQQVDSILNQNCDNWKLVISDDMSTDSTLSIIEHYIKKHPCKIELYKSNKHFGTAQDHFLHLIDAFKEKKYIMLADQDDVWHCDKVSKTFARMRSVEANYEIPVLVHAGSNVVDENLTLIRAYHNDGRDNPKINRMLVNGLFQGCTMMLNSAASRLITKNYPVKMLNCHDTWIGMLVTLCGNVSYIDEALLDYRRYGNNATGWISTSKVQQIIEALKTHRCYSALQHSMSEAQEFIDYSTGIIPSSNIILISNFAKLKNKNFIYRKISYLKNGYLKDGLMKRIAQILLG